MQIAVRVRAVLPHEALQQVAVTCSSDGSSVQVVLPEREFSKPAIAASSKPDAKAYEFDACLTGSTTQVWMWLPDTAHVTCQYAWACITHAAVADSQ
jgi:hypothetical protein